VLVGDGGEVGDGADAVVGVGIDAGADGGAAEAELAEGVGGGGDAEVGFGCMWVRPDFMMPWNSWPLAAKAAASELSTG